MVHREVHCVEVWTTDAEVRVKLWRVLLDAKLRVPPYEEAWVRCKYGKGWLGGGGVEKVRLWRGIRKNQTLSIFLSHILAILTALLSSYHRIAPYPYDSFTLQSARNKNIFDPLNKLKWIQHLCHSIKHSWASYLFATHVFNLISDCPYELVMGFGRNNLWLRQERHLSDRL